MDLYNKEDKEEGAGSNQQDNLPNPSYAADWDFYFSYVDDIIGSFFVDLGLAKVAPLSDKPNLVWISVFMNNPREDGLSSNEEFETLSAIEDRLKEFISIKHSSIYAGRLTTDGHRDFYFYMGDTTPLDKTIAEIMAAYPSYKFDFGINEDKLWESYFGFMYPDPKQFQSLQNRRLVDYLKKSGDPLTKPRIVDHWIYFKSDKDRNTFLSRIENLNFSIISMEKDTSLGDLPFTLHISRTDNVDLASVDEYVLNLWQLAEECNGEYDGWETAVEKD